MNPLPVDFQSFLNLVASQLFIGAVLSWLTEHVPFIADEKVANWKKALFAVLVCILWAIVATLILTGGLPKDANGWYTLLVTAMAVIFANQGVYKFFNALPGFSDFLLAVLGKTPTARLKGLSGASLLGQSSTSTTTAAPPATVTVDAGKG